MSDTPGEARDACPYCGELILTTARKCRYCHEWLDSGEQVPGLSARTGEPVLRRTDRRVAWWDWALMLGMVPVCFVIVGVIAVFYDPFYEYPLVPWVNLMLLVCLATWLARRPYRGFLRWWRWAIVALNVLAPLSLTGS